MHLALDSDCSDRGQNEQRMYSFTCQSQLLDNQHTYLQASHSNKFGYLRREASFIIRPFKKSKAPCDRQSGTVSQNLLNMHFMGDTNNLDTYVSYFPLRVTPVYINQPYYTCHFRRWVEGQVFPFSGISFFVSREVFFSVFFLGLFLGFLLWKSGGRFERQLEEYVNVLSQRLPLLCWLFACQSILAPSAVKQTSPRSFQQTLEADSLQESRARSASKGSQFKSGGITTLEGNRPSPSQSPNSRFGILTTPIGDHDVSPPSGQPPDQYRYTSCRDRTLIILTVCKKDKRSST